MCIFGAFHFGTGINFPTFRTEDFFCCLHYCDFIQKIKLYEKNEVNMRLTLRLSGDYCDFIQKMKLSEKNEVTKYATDS